MIIKPLRLFIMWTCAQWTKFWRRPCPIGGTAEWSRDELVWRKARFKSGLSFYQRMSFPEKSTSKGPLGTIGFDSREVTLTNFSRSPKPLSWREPATSWNVPSSCTSATGASGRAGSRWTCRLTVQAEVACPHLPCSCPFNAEPWRCSCKPARCFISGQR